MHASTCRPHLPRFLTLDGVPACAPWRRSPPTTPSWCRWRATRLDRRGLRRCPSRSLIPCLTRSRSRSTTAPWPSSELGACWWRRLSVLCSWGTASAGARLSLRLPSSRSYCQVRARWLQLLPPPRPRTRHPFLTPSGGSWRLGGPYPCPSCPWCRD